MNTSIEFSSKAFLKMSEQKRLKLIFDFNDLNK